MHDGWLALLDGNRTELTVDGSEGTTATRRTAGVARRLHSADLDAARRLLVDGEARTSSASTTRPPQTSSAVGNVWDSGDGGTELKVSAKQTAESLAHVCSQASARTARHRRPHGQTSTMATIRGVTWKQIMGKLSLRFFKETIRERERNKEESLESEAAATPRRAAEGRAPAWVSPPARERTNRAPPYALL
jgi:hypothetical protein